MTNTPEQYLAEAKDKTAKENNWVERIAPIGELFRALEKAALLALQAQAEDYEGQLKELRLALITRDGNLTSKILKAEIDQLKAELEKAKQLCTESQSSIHGLVQVMNGSYELKDRYMKAVDLVDKLNEFLNPL